MNVCDIRNIKGFSTELVQGNINQTHLFQDKKTPYWKGELPLWKRCDFFSCPWCGRTLKIYMYTMALPCTYVNLSHKPVGRKTSTSQSNLKFQVSFSWLILEATSNWLKMKKPEISKAFWKLNVVFGGNLLMVDYLLHSYCCVWWSFISRHCHKNLVGVRITVQVNWKTFWIVCHVTKNQKRSCLSSWVYGGFFSPVKWKQFSL